MRRLEAHASRARRWRIVAAARLRVREVTRAAGISFKYGLDILKNEPLRSFNERYNNAQGEWENPFAEIIGMICKLSSPLDILGEMTSHPPSLCICNTSEEW